MDQSFPRPIPNGTLALVVGPSGAGKDTLIAEARRQLASDGRYVFPPRVVTRPPGPDAEQNIFLPADRFAEEEASGAFLLAWRSHGLSYGIPTAVADELLRGRVVVINVSRAMISEAERIAANVTVLQVTASPETLAARLSGRGRETSAQIATRIRRDVRLATTRARVCEIVNEGPLGPASDRFITALLKAAEVPPSGSA